MDNEISLQNCIIQQVIPETRQNISVHWDVLRLDLIHPVVSGNKFFKLKYFVERAIQARSKGILSFGGAYSNHILATAFTAKKAGFASIGIIRGEEPSNWSPTLLDARDQGMQFIFTERKKYAEISQWNPGKMEATFPGFTVIPEGGYSITGMKGAAEIYDLIPAESYDWLACACGTGTMLAGLFHRAKPKQKLLGIPILKNYLEMEKKILAILPGTSPGEGLLLDHSFHFGGYAKKTAELTRFMNDFYHLNAIPTDIIYTAKLMFGINALIRKGFFEPGSRILAIHSGGLQGNRSLKKGILAF
jgi:1-aminocyclopropane-1-carboxylate deaminase